MAPRVIVVGSLNVDLVVVGERLPAHGETVTGGSFSQHHGGKGGNQAVAAARLGVATAFVGAVGADAFGEEARAALEAEGIDLEHLTTVDGEATGVAVILVDARGENCISVAGGANLALTPARVRKALERLAVSAEDVVLVGHEIPTPSAREALRVGSTVGATTILNPAPAGGLDRSTLSLADIVTPNRGELAALVAEDTRRIGRAGSPGDRPDRAARSLLDANSEGPGVRRAVIVTLGSSGALLVEGAAAAIDLPAPSVSAIDTVGAGDAFNGALAACLARGLSLADAGADAVRAASLATTKPGAREGMPTAGELESFRP